VALAAHCALAVHIGGGGCAWHRPDTQNLLWQSLLPVHIPPFGTVPPPWQAPLTQVAPVAHCAFDVHMAAPPLEHIPFRQSPLWQSPLPVHMPPFGTMPLPMQTPLTQVPPAAHCAFEVHIGGGALCMQAPFWQRPLWQSALPVQRPPLGTMPLP
jgi:hypothetical protein